MLWVVAPFLAAVALLFAVVGSLLHFWMKIKLERHGLPVTWWMYPGDDWKMWKTYMAEAPLRDWPVWPFRLHKIAFWGFLACAGLFMFALLMANARR